MFRRETREARLSIRQSASVASTEASASLLARFGVVGPQNLRAIIKVLCGFRDQSLVKASLVVVRWRGDRRQAVKEVAALPRPTQTLAPTPIHIEEKKER
jgi:hypothetical protein